MSDDADHASSLEELQRHTAINKARQQPELPVTGFCYYCAEPLNGLRFCDADCRDLFEKEQRLIKHRVAPDT